MIKLSEYLDVFIENLLKSRLFDFLLLNSIIFREDYQSLEERKATYKNTRIKDQLTWYAKKAKFNRKMSKYFFWGLIGINSLAVICAAFRISTSISHFGQQMF
jgi:hypothetical protein